MKTLSFEQMQAVNGGEDTKKEVFCGGMNMIAIGALYFGPAGWLTAAGTVLAAWYEGCYESNN